MRRAALFLIAALVCAVGTAAGAQSRTVKRAYVKPVVCKCKNITAPGKHGNTHIVYSDGKDVAVTTGDNCLAAKSAEDEKTVGWLQGFHNTLRGESGRFFFTDKLRVYRNGKVVRTVQFADGVIYRWDFRSAGTQAAVSVGPGKRGVRYYVLVDIATGKALSRINRADYSNDNLVVDKARLPEWARGIVGEGPDEQ